MKVECIGCGVTLEKEISEIIAMEEEDRAMGAPPSGFLCEKCEKELGL